jgi:hypothetical protein
MKANWPSRTFGLLIGVFLTALPARSQIQLYSLTPAHGPAGTQVALSGAGFPATGPLLVRVGGVNAPILERAPGLIRFSVPDAAATGPVEAVFGGAAVKFPTPFVVTRLITARIAPEAWIAASRYTIGTLYNDAPGTGPEYVVQVAKGEATLVGASAGENDPVLLAMATDATGEVVLSAQSTALAMLYLFPGIQTLNHDEAVRRLEFLAGLPETTALAEMIQSRLETGREYLDVPALEGTLIAGVEAFLAGYTPPAPEPAAAPAAPFAAAGAPGGGNDFVEGIHPLAPGYPRDLETPGYEKLRRLATVSRGPGVNARGLPILKVEVKSAPVGAGPKALRQYVELNPLDWMANLYELNPADADLDTPAKVRNLRGDFSNVYERLGADAIDRMHVKAKPAFRFADLLDLTMDFLLAPVSSPLVAKEHLEIPADRPGLYLIRAYSGARFPPQRTLLNTLPDGRYEDYTMTALNLILAATDLLGFGLKEDLSECRSKFLVSLLAATGQTVDREAAAGTLSSEAITRLFLHTARSYVKDYVLKCMILDKKREGLSQVGKVLAKNIDALGKLATLGKVAERLTALGNLIGATGEPQRIWMAQAIEDTIIVVGNPWQPRITGYFPQSGHRGATVRINGANFAASTNLNIVTFGVLGTDPTNPPVAARAEVLAAAATSLIVRVPENAVSGAISVTVAGKGTATTAGLRPPFQTFEVLADPVITGLSPNPPVAGQVMQIHGSNFARITDRQELVFSAGPAQPVVGSPTLLVVRAPNSIAPNSIKVRINGRESNVLPFMPVLPGYVATGAVIYVSTDRDNTAADGDLSLREAILLAGGGTTALGRALTAPPVPPNPRPPGATYETDYVSVPPGSPGPGVATKDFIQYTGAMIGRTVTVGAALPPLESHDDYNLEFYIDGGGGAGDGIRIPGKLGVRFHANLIQNFSGNGILLSGSASDNVIWDTGVEQCGGDGVRLEGNAQFNKLINLGIYECGHGLRLSGPGVRLNESELNEMADNRGFGVLIDDSAYLNALIPLAVYSNGAGGIRVTGAGTTGNDIRGLRAFSESGLIFDNGGPGIWIDSPSNVVRAVSLGGNLGDGILLEGPFCRDVRIIDTRSGYDPGDGSMVANQGSGLHIRNGAHYLVIGTQYGDISIADIANVHLMNCFAGNRDHGIWIEGAGTSNIWINRTIVGAAATLDDSSIAMPNGAHGIAITGGARGVTIGAGGIHANVAIANHTNGAGIYLAQTADNFVVACKIGRDDVMPGRLGNRYGIHLTQNAHANWIGFEGFRQVVGAGDDARIYDERNYFFGNTEAAILLESGGDPARTINEGEVPAGGNVIRYNRIGASDVAGLENQVGLLLRQGAVINRIENNVFAGNTRAGLLIDGAVIERSFLANRIIRNQFIRQGFRVASPGDPLAALPAGVGIALVNGASGHVIGGNGFWEANDISENHVGVQMANCGSNHLTGNRIHRNRAGGVVVLEGGENTVGPDNEIFRNGTVAASYGGVAIKSSFNNAVLGNWIGLESTDTIATGDGNRHFGIGVFDSIGNLLGDLGGRNIIVGHTNGVVISGPDSQGNQVANNYIGLSPVPGVFTTGNTRAGVLLTNGASQNVIGGTRPWRAGQAVLPHMAGNVIHRNSVDGVRVDGVGTVGNSILYNSIADHSGGLGIENFNLGNAEIPPPTLVSHDGLNVLGAVHPSIPDGSRVQFFWDMADEGKLWAGEELVSGGQFRYVIPGVVPFRLNATVTHAVLGDTSEFAPLFLRTNLSAGLMIHRVSQPPTNAALPWPGPVGVAVAFRLQAFGQPILISTLAFKTTGSANEALPGTQAFLFRDEDQNSRLTQTDFLMAGPRTFSTNDANVTFTTLGRVIEPLADQHWLLVVLPSAGAALGQTFSFEIPAENFLTSRTLVTGEAVTETGEFPLFSDTLVLSPNPAPPADLQMTRTVDGALTLVWTGGGLLESGPSVLGPWTLIPDAATPFRVEPERPHEFFRFRP